MQAGGETRMQLDFLPPLQATAGCVTLCLWDSLVVGAAIEALEPQTECTRTPTARHVPVSH